MPEGSEKNFEENGASMLSKPPEGGGAVSDTQEGGLLERMAYQRGRAYSQIK